MSRAATTDNRVFAVYWHPPRLHARGRMALDPLFASRRSHHQAQSASSGFNIAAAPHGFLEQSPFFQSPYRPTWLQHCHLERSQVHALRWRGSAVPLRSVPNHLSAGTVRYSVDTCSARKGCLSCACCGRITHHPPRLSEAARTAMQ
jgi:hypothetical protein